MYHSQVFWLIYVSHDDSYVTCATVFAHRVRKSMRDMTHLHVARSAGLLHERQFLSACTKRILFHLRPALFYVIERIILCHEYISWQSFSPHPSLSISSPLSLSLFILQSLCLSHTYTHAHTQRKTRTNTPIHSLSIRFAPTLLIGTTQTRKLLVSLTTAGRIS